MAGECGRGWCRVWRVAGAGGVRVPGRGRGGRGWGGSSGCSPVFAGRLAECGRALAPFVGGICWRWWGCGGVRGWSGGGGAAVLWAVMVSLAAVWRRRGGGMWWWALQGRWRRRRCGGAVAGGRGRWRRCGRLSVWWRAMVVMRGAVRSWRRWNGCGGGGEAGAGGGVGSGQWRIEAVLAARRCCGGGRIWRIAAASWEPEAELADCRGGGAVFSRWRAGGGRAELDGTGGERRAVRFGAAVAALGSTGVHRGVAHRCDLGGAETLAEAVAGRWCADGERGNSRPRRWRRRWRRCSCVAVDWRRCWAAARGGLDVRVRAVTGLTGWPAGVLAGGRARRFWAAVADGTGRAGRTLGVERAGWTGAAGAGGVAAREPQAVTAVAVQDRLVLDQQAGCRPGGVAAAGQARLAAGPRRGGARGAAASSPRPPGDGAALAAARLRRRAALAG